MRSIFSLSDAGHSLMLILLFLALLFQLFVFCIGCFYRAKWTHCKMLSILAAISFLSLSFLTAGTARQTFDEPMWAITRNVDGYSNSNSIRLHRFYFRICMLDPVA